MEQRNGFVDTIRALPLAHQVVMGIAVAVLGLAGFVFMQWVSTPTYTVLYTNIAEADVATVVAQLEQQDIPYRLEGGGSRVLVPRARVYEVRAELAAAGVNGSSVPQGYEILDDQGLNVSDFRQRVDYQRALEGELAKTLLAMDAITAATVHLVMPERALFVEDEEPVTASVLVDSVRDLTEMEVETITFLVASSVEGLQVNGVTVADVAGLVLHAAGELDQAAGLTNRNLRMTRDYEQSLAADVRQLLSTVNGPGTASVVVRAVLDFDEHATESETYDAETATALREQTIDESFNGSGVPPGGTVGVDGGAIPESEIEDGYTYDRNEVTREYGVDRIVTRTVTAPGAVKQLSVAVVMDDGSLTGAVVPDVAETEALISAGLGLDPARGDAVAVSMVAFPAADAAVEGEAAAAAPAMNPLDMIPTALGGLVLLGVMVALLLMSRTSKSKGIETVADALAPAALGTGSTAAAAGAATVLGAAPAPSIGLQPEVIDLVQRQPEEIAVLLRGWLADRR